ncbi:hypothetical protein M2352_000511 [Azospirillum fermentarium]|nr:hypothetical protein [Azospirillum fermentarium]
MNILQFREALAKDQKALNDKQPTPGVKGCGTCGVPLQESITGCRKCGDKYVCSDCYFEAFGEVLEAHPIGAFRVLRGA